MILGTTVTPKLLKKVFILTLIFSIPLFAQAAPNAKTAAKIQGIVNSVNPQLDYGLTVVTPDHQTLLNLNGGQTFIPASNIKLYTEAAALIYLGPHYQFQTKLFTNANQIKNGVLKGNLTIKFSGDPSLSREDLNNLMSKLHRYNIHTIQGNIYLDTSDYQAKVVNPGWMTSDTRYGYGAPIGPLILDQNMASLLITPGARVKDKAFISFKRTDPDITLINKLTTYPRTKKNCSITFLMNNKNQITVSGCSKESNNSFVQTVAIKNPVLYAKAVIGQILQQQKIELRGTIQQQPTPSTAILLASFKSPLLFSLINHTLKVSANLFAETVFLKMGELYYHQPATWQNGAKAVKAILQNQTQINLKDAVIMDGSGLSRYNLASPQQTAQLLNYLYHDFPITYEFISALPIAGEDGTLINRMKQQNLNSIVRAKTGGMTGVNSLSGYLMNKNQQLLIFSLMMDNYKGSQRTYHDLTDRLIKQLQNLTYSADVQLKTNSNSTQIQQITYSTNNLSDNRIQKQKLQSKQLVQLESLLRKKFKNSGLVILGGSNSITLSLPGNKAFNYDSSKLKKTITPMLAKIINVINSNPPNILLIKGYTSGIQDSVLNEKLSFARADAVKNYLVAHGLNPANMLVVGYGTHRPLYSNATKLDRELNRRVGIELRY